MVKITNGMYVFEVSKGAFAEIFSRQGYILVEEPEEVQLEENNQQTEDEVFLSAIIEKPISQWSKEEIKKFAELNSIDLVGTKNTGEAKERIKEYLDTK